MLSTSKPKPLKFERQVQIWSTPALKILDLRKKKQTYLLSVVLEKTFNTVTSSQKYYK